MVDVVRVAATARRLMMNQLGAAREWRPLSHETFVDPVRRGHVSWHGDVQAMQAMTIV